MKEMALKITEKRRGHLSIDGRKYGSLYKEK
jgi:hypothetical protein